MKHHHLALRDLWLVFSAAAIGMSLVYVLLSSGAQSKRVTIGSIGFGIALIGMSTWSHLRKSGLKVYGMQSDEVVIDRVNIVVDAEGSAELLFAPQTPVTNPRLVMTAHGRPVTVEDVWRDVHTAAPTSNPRPISQWRYGVTYAGVLSVAQPLCVLLRNEGFAPARVSAMIVAVVPKE